MARYFFDSSALVKRYHQERGSADIARLFNEPGARFLISRLALVEVHSSFARLVREGVISKSDFDMLIARLEADVASRLLHVAAMSSQRLQETCSLLRSHGLVFPLRTLDAVHLVTAEALHGRTRLAAFVAADKKLLAVAGDICLLPVMDVS